LNDTAIHDTLTVQVVYLARLREAFGTSGERLPLRRGADAVTVADVLSTLAARGGIYATELAPGRAVRIAVNHAIVSRNAPIRHGDEVALLPPVTGG
jgi:molybdopterin synthase sulfur carrier subunit